MIRSTQQIIPIMHFYFYLSFAFYILSWKKRRRRRMLRRARELLGHLTGSPRLCVWGARWSDRDSSVLAKRRNFLLVRTTTWLVGPSPPRPIIVRLLCCLCLQNPLCVWSKCWSLLAPVLLAAEKCRPGFLPIIALRPDCRQAQCSPCDEEDGDGDDEEYHY